jgi:hypothetical protein
VKLDYFGVERRSSEVLSGGDYLFVQEPPEHLLRLPHVDDLPAAPLPRSPEMGNKPCRGFERSGITRSKVAW